MALAEIIKDEVYLMTREFSTSQEQIFNRTSTWRWILAHLAPLKLFVVLYLLGSLISQALGSAIPRITGLAIDAILNHPSLFSSFLLLTLILFVVVIARGLFGISANYSLERVANAVERDVRDELYIALLGKSQAFFNRHRAGDLMARATDDTTQINEMFAPGVEIFLGTLLSVVLPLIFIAFINPVLLLSPLIFMVLFSLAIWHYSNQLAPASREVREQNGVLTAELTEFIAGFELIEITGQKDFVRRRFADHVARYRDLFVRLGRVQALYYPPLLLAIVMVAAFLHGFILVTRGVLTIGDLIAYLGLVGMLSAPTVTISMSISLLQTGLSSARRILEILKDDTALDENRSGYTERMRGDLVFDDVSFNYEGTPILEHVSFRVPAGQTLALVGPTGSGKTMITKLINRIYDCDSGRILIDGVDVRNWNLDSLRSQIGIIEQDVVLFSRSISDNIRFGVGAHVDQGRIEEAARAAQAHSFITSFYDGYRTPVGERGVTLSGGQRQRLAIARALLTDPRLLILDDSTSAIDSATEEEIQRAIRRVAAHRTTILITHRLAQIRQAALILVLNQGKVVDQGTHAELLARCVLYQRIFAPYYKGEDDAEAAQSFATRHQSDMI